MNLLLSIPFRTKINLHPRFSVSRTKLFAEMLNLVRESAQESLNQVRVKAMTQHDEGQSGLYRSIDEDALPSCVLPLFSVEWSRDQIDIIPIEGPPGVGVRKLESATLSYFDHTIGILELRLRMEGVINKKVFAESLDHWSFALATKWIERSNAVSDAIEQGLEGLVLPKHSFFAPIEIADAYFDRHSTNQTNPQRDLLWVSRALILEAPPSDIEWLRYWTQDQLDEADRVQIGDFNAALRVGNSVIFGPWNEVGDSAFTRALLLCNRFYAIAHVLSTNQRLTHARFLSEEIDPEYAGVLTTSIRSRLDLLQHEYEDTMLGVQGLRRVTMRTYMQAWGFENLIKTIERRIASVDVLVHAALQRRNLRYTRLVEAALTMIGGLALLDFAVNLLNFSRTPGLALDTLPGLVDIAQVISEDALLYSLLAVILYLVYGKIRRR